MPFLGLFRSNEEKLADALLDSYNRIFWATFKSNQSLLDALKEQWNTQAEPLVDYALRREFYCFYLHILGYYSFGTLGEGGRDFVMDRAVPMGIAPFVWASHPGAGDKIWEPEIANLLELFNAREFEYAESASVFVENMMAVLQNGGVPGVNDALSDYPGAKVSRLIQNLNGILKYDVPGLETKSELALGLAEGLGADQRAMSLVVLCAVIQNSVFVELANSKLIDSIRKMRSLIR